ncbi:MAG: hypothetical protein ABIU09_01165 [Pyrinomonadaceae bacterium]
MPKKWYERVRTSRHLKVFNGAGVWSKHVLKAIDDFNGLPFNIVLDKEPDENKADVVVILSDGKSTVYPRGGRKINGTTITANFDAAKTHGQAGSFLDSRDRISKVVIFLPEKLKDVPDEIKVLVVVHELIHSCGLVEKRDHDPVGGILSATLQLFDGKLREASTDKNLKGMPPIRVGGWTQCQIADLWKTSDDGKTLEECIDDH